MAEAFQAHHIYQRAHVLAESGAHNGSAEPSLPVAEGYPEAAELLNTDNIRADLSRVCEVATESPPHSRASSSTLRACVPGGGMTGQNRRRHTQQPIHF
jgi:hypothetical protein